MITKVSFNNWHNTVCEIHDWVSLGCFRFVNPKNFMDLSLIFKFKGQSRFSFPKWFPIPIGNQNSDSGSTIGIDF